MKLATRTGWFCLLLGLLVPAALAQQASITGVVTDADDGAPLLGANVVVNTPGAVSMAGGAATDANGRYTISALDPGDYVVTFRFIGYGEQQVDVTLSAGETRTLDMVLSPEGFDLEAVVVTASRQEEKVLDAPASISVLSARDVVQNVAPSSIEALRNTTGVDISQTGVDRREVVLRGFNNAFSGATYVLTDYRQAAVPSLGVNIYSIMPNMSLDVERVEVVRGPGSALYGAGVDAGVIHFITKDPFTSPGTTVSVFGGERSMIGGQARHAGVIGDNLGYKITGIYGQADDWRFDLDDPDDQEQLVDSQTCGRDEAGNVINFDPCRNNDYKKVNVNGLLQYRINDRTTLSANAGYSALTATVLSGIGTVQAEDFGYSYGQVRLQAGNFFSQVYVNRNSAGDSFVYATDLDGDGVPDPVVDKSVQVNAQAQYDLGLMDERLRFIFGADFENTMPATEGTILGGNEDDDTITEYGGYVQSTAKVTPKLDLTLALRGDYNNIFEEFQISPRAAVVYKVTPQHSVRATYNRAFSSPGTNSLFLDIPARTVPLGGGLQLQFRGRGAAQGFTFTNFRSNNTIAFSLPVPGLFNQQVPLNAIPLQAVYGLLLNQLQTAETLPAPLNNLNAEQRAALLGVLNQLTPALAGQTTGAVLGFPNDIGGLDFVNGPVDIEPLKQTTSQVFELGYKGVFNNRFLFTVDGYYVQKENFVGPLNLESPLAFALGVGPDLAEALMPAITAAAQDPQVAGFLQALGLTPQTAAALLGNLAGAELMTTPFGIVQPDQALVSDPNIVAGFLSYRNYGNLTYYGVDASFEFLASDQVSVFGNVSMVSDDFFDSEELDEEDPSLTLALNASTLKVKAGASYEQPGSFSVNAAGRYVEGFPVQSGPYLGEIESYFLLDLGGGYDFARYAPGLRLDVTVSNVLDNMHYEFIGAPQLGRMALARLTYSF